MTRLLRAFLLLVALAGLAARAGADDISATARGVVRIVTIAVVDDQVVGFGHGSGVAIAPNRIVTNAHVVELAQRYPDNVVIGVVPSAGDKSFQGRLVAYDAKRDLAMIEFSGAALPAATLYTGPMAEGDPVVALGYPGNVDLATAQSAADYIKPMAPVRSQGVFSGKRALAETQVLLHTASIARGNSGGPLLDRCGRVVGINSAITRGEEGDSSFAFAIADTELAAFLQAAQQPYASVGTPCTAIEDRLRADSEDDRRDAADAATARREAATAATMQHEEALADARADAEATRENVMALATLLLVAGALAIGGAGLLATRGDDRARLAAIGGGVLIVTAVTTFVLRPSSRVKLADVAAAAGASPVSATGAMLCRFVPERSRITVSSTADVPFGWGKAGCVNGRAQYVEDGARWSKVLVPNGEDTVSLLDYDPATRIYTNTRYLLGPAEMKAARDARGDEAPGLCTADPAARAQLAQRQTAIRATLPPLPNEKLVYRCSPAR